MSRFWFAARIAALFALLLGIALAGAFVLFMKVAGHELVDELATLRAYQGVAVAEEIEPLLDLHAPSAAAVHARVAAAAARRGVRMALVEPPAAAGDSGRRGHPWMAPLAIHAREVEIDGRRCRMLGAPSFATLVPVLHGGREVAALEVYEGLHTLARHVAFRDGLGRIGLVALVSVIGLALYLTLPIRRMSRSMDRIAAGELGHRVRVRGRSEVATMGLSFNAMADRIESLLTGQKELMAGVSHELRSPLARIKLRLELLRQARGDLHAAEIEKLDGAQDDIDLLDGLVGELLLASRFDLGAVELDLRDLDLAEIAGSAWQRVADAALAKGMRLDLHLEASAGEASAGEGSAGEGSAGEGSAGKVNADPALLVRLLGNLFENAVRHAARGVVTLEARPRPAESGAERVEIKVTDQGPGVAEEHLPRLFEPFYRADPSRSRRTGAGGLGLMIVRRAVEAHGGEVRAELAVSGGLVVVFDLPPARSAVVA